MISSAAADSGEGVRVAASTTDQRVLGKTRGASLAEAWLLMRTSYQEQLSETRRLLQTLVKDHNFAAVKNGSPAPAMPSPAIGGNATPASNGLAGALKANDSKHRADVS